MPTKVRLDKAMVFPVVMYGCESWTVKKDGKTTEWERLEISSRKSEIPKEHFLKRWAHKEQKWYRPKSAEELMLLNCGVGEDS